MEERVTTEHPDKEIETKQMSPTELLPQKFTPRRQLAKQSIKNCRNKQRESPKMGRQRMNMQSKGRFPSKKAKWIRGKQTIRHGIQMDGYKNAQGTQ